MTFDAALARRRTALDERQRDLQRRTPMKRTPFQRRRAFQAKPKVEGPKADLTETAPTRRKQKKAPKKRPGRDPRMLDACRGQHCYLRLPGICRDDTATTVPAHRNEGKGMGLKVDDEQTVPACYWCHYEYDQGKTFTREQKRGFFNDAYPRWAAYRDMELNHGNSHENTDRHG
jgi:hypothetical protein